MKKMKIGKLLYRVLLVCIFVLFFTFQGSLAMAATLYVEAGGTGDGTSWATPYGDIATAVSSAIAGDEVWIKEGSFLISNTITINKAIILYAGFPASLPSPDMTNRHSSFSRTIIDGQNSVHHCFDLVGGNITLDGLEITGGNHVASSAAIHYLGGAGIAIFNSNNNIIRNCTINDNTSNNTGAGIVISGSSGTLVENCTLESNSSSTLGGAIVIWECNNTTISNSVFRQNHTTSTSSGGGGAIYVQLTSSATDVLSVTGSSFVENYTTYGSGGAITTGGDYLISDCQFTGNHANNPSYDIKGGAIYSNGGAGEIVNCTFTENYTLATRDSMGGAVALSYDAIIRNCNFIGNKARSTGTSYGETKGGALYLSYSSNSTLISGCTFKENKSYGDGTYPDRMGGAMFIERGSPKIENCLFGGNSAQKYGGAIAVLDTGTPIINNCTLTENYAGTRGGGIYNNGSTPDINNSIIWNNSAPSYPSIWNYSASSVPWISYTAIDSYGFVIPPGHGPGIIANDPLFVTTGLYSTQGTSTVGDDSWTEGDYNLQGISPCLDKGTAIDMPVVDLAGIVRPQGTYHDLGSYERQNTTAVFTLSASVSGGHGGLTPESGRYYSTDTVVVSLAASPDSHYHVATWAGTDDDNSTLNTNSVTMDNDKIVTVSFAIETFTLSYATDGSGSISGTASQIIDYGGAGSLVTAVPNTGYSFVKWNDDVMSAGRTEINVMADISVSASFAINTYALEYTAGSNGAIAGTTSQAVDYDTSGTQVMAVPYTGYHFNGWSDLSTDNPRTDSNVTADISVSANFAIDTFLLTYTAGVNGSITGSSSQTVDYNTTGTTVTAVADQGYHFVDWNDNSTDNPRIDRNVTGDISVSANFSDKYSLSVIFEGNGAGTVSIQPGSFDSCVTDCSVEFTQGDSVTLTAVATEKKGEFLGWSGGGCSGTVDCTVTMDQAREVTATFKGGSPWTLFMPAILTATQQSE